VTLVHVVLSHLGIEETLKYVRETAKKEEEGGVLTVGDVAKVSDMVRQGDVARGDDVAREGGKRRRSPGGCFLFLVKEGVGEEMRKAIFTDERAKASRKETRNAVKEKHKQKQQPTTGNNNNNNNNKGKEVRGKKDVKKDVKKDGQMEAGKQTGRGDQQRAEEDKENLALLENEESASVQVEDGEGKEEQNEGQVEKGQSNEGKHDGEVEKETGEMEATESAEQSETATMEPTSLTD
jgi:hypothetical protein